MFYKSKKIQFFNMFNNLYTVSCELSVTFNAIVIISLLLIINKHELLATGALIIK